jgi:8-oxo-dGTP pyrophosphatase MutT (NUDIX family)
MFASLIQSLIPHLPRFAEEDGDFYSIHRDELIETLCQQHELDRSVSENTVTLIEALLNTLAVLDVDYLKRGEWCFVSFPAQLMALSVLTALSDNDSQLFAPNFWNNQGISNDKKDQQRDVLRALETARVKHHTGQAQPIRYCYVAWSIIKLDHQVLFYQREDTQKRFDKSAGDYGLIGGRANQNDVLNADEVEALKALQSPHSALIKDALPETLKRELREEAGLLFETHYRFKPWRSLKPYQQVQGTAPNHAFTEYYLGIFQIELTLEGYLYLLEKTKGDERLVWFSLDEIAKGETADGKIAYIKALFDDFDNDRTALKTALQQLPDSFKSAYLCQLPKYGLTLPVDHHKPLIAGVLGKEKPLNLELSDYQLKLFLALAAHLRGFEFEALPQTIKLHPMGWLEVKNDPGLQRELIQLATLLKQATVDFSIENIRDIFFRLSIIPEIVHFDESLFSFTVKQSDLDSIETKIPVRIHRDTFETAIGWVKSKTEAFKLTLEFVSRLRELAEKDWNADNEYAVRIEDAYKKGLHKEPKFCALGLRSLIRREDGMIKVVVSYDRV